MKNLRVVQATVIMTATILICLLLYPLFIRWDLQRSLVMAILLGVALTAPSIGIIPTVVNILVGAPSDIFMRPRVFIFFFFFFVIFEIEGYLVFIGNYLGYILVPITIFLVLLIAGLDYLQQKNDEKSLFA